MNQSAASGAKLSPTVEVISTFDALASLRQDWNQLWTSEAAGNLFSSFDWIDLYWRVYGDDPSFWGEKEFLVLVVKLGGTVAGLAPLRRRKAGRPGMRVNVVDFITGAESYQDFVIGQDKEIVVDAVAGYLASVRASWDVIDLRNFPPSSSTAALLRAALARNGIACRTLSDAATFQLALTGSWDSYLEAQPGRRRKLFRRQSRQLQEAGIAIRIIENPQKAPEVLPAILALERKKTCRKDQQGLSDRDIQQFLGALLDRFGPRHMAYVALAEQGRVPVAYQLGFRIEDELWDFCTAYDPEYARYSPGTMLMPALIDWAHGTGARRLDFLRGDLGYKRAWTPVTRRNIRLVAWNRRLPAFAYVRLRPWLYRCLSRLGIRSVPEWEI